MSANGLCVAHTAAAQKDLAMHSTVRWKTAPETKGELNGVKTPSASSDPRHEVIILDLEAFVQLLD